jgi:hypothetical protein
MLALVNISNILFLRGFDRMIRKLLFGNNMRCILKDFRGASRGLARAVL